MNNWRLLLLFWTPNSYKKNVRLLDFVAGYFGAKQGFYFAWLIHYTSWLLLPSLIGLFMTIWQLVEWRIFKPDLSFFEGMESVWAAFFSLFIAIWTTLLVESWKNKEAYFSERWHMRNNNEEITSNRKEFKASLYFDGELQ
jgi:hypothetical protein